MRLFVAARDHRLRCRFTDREAGATMIEYGLMVGLIAVVAVVGVTLFGTSIQDLFETSIEQMP